VQFVGVGLIVGIAGIGVIMIRAVRERRREVGVLRSLGFAARRVAAVMVFEATFIALQSIIIGVTVALVASYFFSTADADWAEGVSWAIPTTSVALIVAVAVTATLVTALWPAPRAAAIHPAVALRAAD
jgi:putative ABC transport system permease protein